MREKPRKNTDPITGEPGARLVGTGVGAAGGAATTWQAEVPLQKPLISAENFITCDDENRFVDFVVGREEFAGCFNGNPRCFLNRITVGAATDRREGYRLDSVLNAEQQ